MEHSRPAGLGGALRAEPHPPQHFSKVGWEVKNYGIYLSIIYPSSIIYLSIHLPIITGGRNFKCIVGKMLCRLRKQTHKNDHEPKYVELV